MRTCEDINPEKTDDNTDNRKQEPVSERLASEEPAQNLVVWSEPAVDNNYNKGYKAQCKQTQRKHNPIRNRWVG